MARGNTLATERYDTRDEEVDDEGIETRKSDTYINETISNISIAELDQVIRDKKRNGYGEFKREYAVSEDISCDL